jgi:adenylate cyclase
MRCSDAETHYRETVMGETPDTPETLAVLFADICDSTRLYHDLGDSVAHNLAAQCLKAIADVTTRNGGTVIKTIGDGSMVTFPNVFQAYRSAINIQDELRDGPLRLKIGLHIGPVIRADDDVYGDTVNVAARVLARSGPGEILMSGSCAERLRPEERATVRLLDTTAVKGRPEALEIYSYIGDATNVTIIVPSAKREAGVALVLMHRANEVRLEATGAPLLMGRDATCGLVIDSELASRRHATIEVQRTSFVLTDHSSNGTFVVPDQSGIPQFLRREAVHLAGSGVISVGMAADQNADNLIRYRHEGRRASDRG